MSLQRFLSLAFFFPLFYFSFFFPAVCLLSLILPFIPLNPVRFIFLADPLRIPWPPLFLLRGASFQRAI